MSRIVGRVAPVLVLLLSLVLAGCSMLPGQARKAAEAPPVSTSPTATGSPTSSPSADPTDVASGPAPGEPLGEGVDWDEVGPGWMVVLLSSTADSTTRLVLVSPEGVKADLTDLPAGAELWSVSARVDQIMIALPGSAKGAKLVTLIDPRVNDRATLPGEYNRGQFFHSGEASLLLWRAGAKHWTLADYGGETVEELPRLTGATVLTSPMQQLILGTDVGRREFVLVDGLRFNDGEAAVQRGKWDRDIRQCKPVAVSRGWGQFFCAVQGVSGAAVLADFQPGKRTDYWVLNISRKRALTMKAYLVDGTWLFSEDVSCGGSLLYTGEDLGKKSIRGFDRTTALLQVDDSQAHVLVSPVCGKPATRIEVRTYKGGKKLLYSPPAGFTILAAEVLPSAL